MTTLDAKIRIDWPSLNLDVDLNFESDRIVAIMGPNGAGKSTLLRTLAGLTPIHKGRISMDERTWDDPEFGTFVSPGSRHVGLVFQDHVLFPHLTARENIAFGPQARGLSRRASLEAATACLERFGLQDIADHRPVQLSGGQSQRIALARALINHPRLLLLDEPLASLDVTTRRSVRKEIARDLAGNRPMTLLVTHDPEDARRLADDVLVIEHGSVVQRGTIDQLTSRPATPYVAELFGSPQ